MVAPITTVLKLFIQDLWKQRFDWDGFLPKTIIKTWNVLRTNMTKISEIKFHRYINLPRGKNVTYE